MRSSKIDLLSTFSLHKLKGVSLHDRSPELFMNSSPRVEAVQQSISNWCVMTGDVLNKKASERSQQKYCQQHMQKQVTTMMILMMPLILLLYKCQQSLKYPHDIKQCCGVHSDPSATVCVCVKVKLSTRRSRPQDPQLLLPPQIRIVTDPANRTDHQILRLERAQLCSF